MMNFNIYIVIGSSFLVFVPIYAQKKICTRDEQPNVIFLVADDLGYGDLSCYGMRCCQTPNVDQLAANGLLFTNAHSVAATSTPSRYSLFTGHYSWRRNDTGIAPGDAGMIIRPEQITVADLFKREGYSTGAIGKWHLGMGSETGKQNWNETVTPNPTDIGFDYFCLIPATADRVPCVWLENGLVLNYDASHPISVSYNKSFEGEPTGKNNPELLTNLKPSHKHDQAIVNGISRIGFMKGGGKALWKDEDIADTIIAKSVNFIKQNSDKSFFWYIGTNDIHVPRFPHPRFVGKSGMGYRGDAILQFDYTVGEIVKTLRQENLLENTLFILTSDNGPVIDDGYEDQSVELLGDHRPWGAMRGGKYSSFEAGTRVPFIVHWPKKVSAGTSDALVSHIDLFASMASLIGQKSKGAGGDSSNQLRALLGKDNKGRAYVVESAKGLSIYDGEWKYITPNNAAPYAKFTDTELGNSTQEQLYNLRDDIGEKKNLFDKYPIKAKKLKKLLQKEIEREVFY